MLNTQKLRRPAGLAAIALTTGLAGCSKAVVLNPAGDIAAQQGQMVITATLLMLIIIVPVIALTLFFAWKYRQSMWQRWWRRCTATRVRSARPAKPRRLCTAAVQASKFQIWPSGRLKFFCSATAAALSG